MKRPSFVLHSSLFASLVLLASMTMMSCQESLEDRAEREAREYTLRNCPTPPENNVITDSLVFDKATKTQYYYLTFVGELDNETLMEEFKDKLDKGLLEQTRSNPQLKIFQEAGFTFAYVCRSKATGKVILNLKYTPEDYRHR